MPPIVTSAEIESPPAEVFAYAFDQVHWHDRATFHFRPPMSTGGNT